MDLKYKIKYEGKMDYSEAYKEICDISKRIEEEVAPSCATNVENMIYAQTKGILTFIKAMLFDKIKGNKDE